MSRIHEALKRAEQERGLARTAEGAVTTMVDASPPLHAPADAAPQRWTPDSPEALLSQCAAPLWSPQAKVASLFSAAGPAAGTEELRTLRSRLNQIREKQKLQTVLITSAMPSEGKTFMTACLARMMARQQGKRVLMIDADLRRPQMDAILGAPNSPGLTDYLNGAADEAAILQRGLDPNLYLIPSGKHVSNAAELLSSTRLPQLLRKMETVFDWILLDSPPVVPVHDASVLSGYVDGVLLVVRSASTAFDLAQRAASELREKGLLGVVLNHVDEGQTYQSYKYYYGGRDKAPEGKQQ